MTVAYENRRDAGRILAKSVAQALGPNLKPASWIVLALPRGGVPVGFEMAQALGIPLDVLVVRKLGLPGHEELAMGAIASGGGRFIHQQVMRDMGVSAEQLDEATQRERRELQRREQAYRGERNALDVRNRSVILVDDGLATGSTMIAAARALGKQPRQVVVTVPVAPPDTVEHLGREVDRMICPVTPDNFRAVGQFYRQFDQTSDDEVRDLLQRAWRDDT